MVYNNWSANPHVMDPEFQKVWLKEHGYSSLEDYDKKSKSLHVCPVCGKTWDCGYGIACPWPDKPETCPECRKKSFIGDEYAAIY